MTVSTGTLAVGTRGSRLGLIQARAALEGIRALCPQVRFDLCAFASPGDRDQALDLRESPADFFTRDLDDALAAGQIDLAIHSAKDVPDPVADGLDWCWLPWREDARDVLVLPPGKTVAALPREPRIGVSSSRREAWCRQRFPGAVLLPVRGVIEKRLEQLDSGGYDLLVMAAAALIRLGLPDRISEWIAAADIDVPDGQGVLAVTFRRADARLRRLRNLFVKTVTVAGAGCGRAGTCTLEVADALRTAGVCLHDALLDHALLDLLPPEAPRVDVGKRAGDAPTAQETINAMLTRYARRGQRVVRLKGGDPGMFGRLGEELGALEAWGLPYRVLPGISSLTAAPLENGILLTGRGRGRCPITEPKGTAAVQGTPPAPLHEPGGGGFCVLTATRAGGDVADLTAAARGQLPAVYFMGTAKLAEIADAHQREGGAENEAAAVVAVGADGPTVVRAPVGQMAAAYAASGLKPPALVVVGPCAAESQAHRSPPGALAGRRILLTGTAPVNQRAAQTVRDLSGVPVFFPLFELVYEPACESLLRDLRTFDLVVLASPMAVDFLRQALAGTGQDWRALRKVAVCGPGSAAVLREHGIQPDIVPERDYGAVGLTAALAVDDWRGRRVLRLTSDRSEGGLSAALAGAGMIVTECVLYRNRARYFTPQTLPTGEAILLTCPSAVSALVAGAGRERAAACDLIPLGTPTAKAIEAHGLKSFVMPAVSTAPDAILAYAAALAWAPWFQEQKE